ncbi:MAG TPA: ABC transporter permease [Acidimicrobiales bacterium]|nr:ABC transporter permease [Acidimicrobiales bacterium]
MLTFIILGIFGGASYALASMGIVLTYKTAGIFNFAYGAVAMFCAFVFWQFRDVWGLSQWISLPLVLLAVAPVLGLILEAVFRPLATAAVEVQIVVALGVLSFFMTLVPLPILWGGVSGNLPTIFLHGHARVAGVLIQYSGLGELLVSAALAGGLYLLLTRSSLGTATRAVVDNRELAGLIAVNSNRIGQVTWIISTVFAAISGILLTSDEGLIYYVLPTLVLYSFSAAVFARLTSLPLAFAGSIALGIIQNVLAKYGSSGTLANVEASIPYLAMLVLLVVYGSRLKEVRSSLRSLPAPSRFFERERFTLPVGVAGAVVFGIVAPQLFGGSVVHGLAEAMAFAIVAMTVVVLTGWTGQISIAQMSFAGIGAFAMAHVAGTDGALFPVGILVGALIAVPVGILIGLPSLRLSGLFLALATLAFALVMDTLVFSFTSITGGLTGLSVAKASIGPVSLDSPTAQFYLCLAVLTVVCSGAWLLKRGPVGRRLSMVRDSPAAASTLGANLTLTKLAVFAGCSVVAAIGGGLLAVTQQTVDPANFSWGQSLEVLLLVVIGGRSMVSGALLAGALDLVNGLIPGIPVVVHQYFPLTVAVTVLLIAKGSQGLMQNAVEQARYCMAVLYRLPRPEPTRSAAASGGEDRAGAGAVSAHGETESPHPAPVTTEMPALTPASAGGRRG